MREEGAVDPNRRSTFSARLISGLAILLVGLFLATDLYKSAAFHRAMDPSNITQASASGMFYEDTNVDKMGYHFLTKDDKDMILSCNIPTLASRSSKYSNCLSYSNGRSVRNLKFVFMSIEYVVIHGAVGGRDWRVILSAGSTSETMVFNKKDAISRRLAEARQAALLRMSLFSLATLFWFVWGAWSLLRRR